MNKLQWFTIAVMAVLLVAFLFTGRQPWLTAAFGAVFGFALTMLVVSEIQRRRASR